MQKAFSNHLHQNQLLPDKGIVILAVSGGVDSVVMAHLFHRIEVQAVIAHCNFHLRGEESNEDERFVRDLGKHLGFEVLVKHFDTHAEVEKRGESVQMVARDLRFGWFDELLKKDEYSVVAAAHHLDDQIETFFINLLRGTGISGLRSILPKQYNVIHPMLFSTRKQIEGFAMKENIAYRDDSSNESLKYRRNVIRHKLIPVLADLEPGFREAFKGNFELLRSAETMLNDHADRMMNDCVKQKGERVFIDKSSLRNIPSAKEVFSYYLVQYGFHRNTTLKAFDSLGALSGKQFYSPTHRLLNDRDDLILEPLQDEALNQKVMVEESTNEIHHPLKLKFTKQPFASDLVISSDKNIAMLDIEKLEFPLTIRRWKQGDAFHPLGMTGKKKVSDFFIDSKFSISEKENTFFLLSGRRIVWVIGHRIDHRYRITSDTKQILKIELFES